MGGGEREVDSERALRPFIQCGGKAASHKCKCTSTYTQLHRMSQIEAELPKLS
jgi:hypothetical protein